MQMLTCQVGACSSSLRLVDTRDHDDGYVTGEPVGKNTLSVSMRNVLTSVTQAHSIILGTLTWRNTVNS